LPWRSAGRTLHWATADGSADSTDYVQACGTLTFAPGVTSLRLPVGIKGDALDEPDETFFVDLSSPEHATIERGRATVTIVDDDPAPSASSTPTSTLAGACTARTRAS
jgi:hypothetical protein